MSVQKMKIVSVIGKYEKFGDAIEAYLDSGCFQPEATDQMLTSDFKGFVHINDENPYADPLQKLTDLMEGAGVPTVCENPENTHMKEQDVLEYVDHVNEELGALTQAKAETEKEIQTNEEAAGQLSHFSSLNVKLSEVFASRYIKVRFGRLPIESYEKLQFYNENPYVLFFPCSTDNQYYWGMYVAPLDNKNQVDQIFASLFFERLHIPDTVGTPEDAVAELNRQRAQAKEKVKALEGEIQEYREKEENRMKVVYTNLKRFFEAFEIRRFGTRYNDMFMLIGWIPESQSEHFAHCMDQVDAIEYKIENPENMSKLKPPTVLKNKGPFKSFEYYVEMFGLPSYNELDPTPFIAVTYTLLYGVMFADVGQGLVLALAGWLMWKLKKMRLGRILIPCGISGAIFGLLFGSVFGLEDVLDPLYRMIGFTDGKPFQLLNNIALILLISIAVGVVMLIFALVLGVVAGFKRRQLGQALFGSNGIAGLLVYLSIIAIVGSLFVPVLASARLYIVLLGIALPLILMFFEPFLGGWVEKKPYHPDSIGEFCLQGVFELFETLISYVTNTVSFLRIGAFVLVHAVLMMVFVTFFEMIGGVGGVIILVLGNVFVIVLEGLLVGIQSLRLEFYEMFSRFYEGEGQPFEPATIDGPKQ